MKASKQDKAKKCPDNNEQDTQAVLKKASKQDKAKKCRVNNEQDAQAALKKASERDKAEKRRVELEHKKRLDAQAQFGRSSNSRGEKELKDSVFTSKLDDKS